eukprot:jgi/Tetstr1/449763/TSEL_036828.t1
MAGTAASPELHGGLMGVLKHHHKKVGGIIKQNTNAVKNRAATHAFPGDNVEEGAKASSGPFGSRAGCHTAMEVAAAATRERARRRGTT